MILDLHTHSVFSDGHVWPRIRVEEALRDGLDGLAVTEHVEYQPHRADLPTAHDRSFQIAAPHGRRLGVQGLRLRARRPARRVAGQPPETPSTICGGGTSRSLGGGTATRLSLRPAGPKARSESSLQPIDVRAFADGYAKPAPVVASLSRPWV